MPDSTANRRILVIDDNRSIHEDFRKILCPQTDRRGAVESVEAALFGEETCGSAVPSFTMESAYQGQDGLALLRQRLASNSPFAMAFVDVRMPPGWDGIETVTHLWEADPNLQVVICTAYSDYSWDQIARRLGSAAQLVILKKPFDVAEVLQLANAMTEKWRLASEARQRLEDLEGLIRERTRDLEAAHAELVAANRRADHMAGVAPGFNGA
jgi:DNA-binding NtrC family response regulator